jgi:hypothetical protein
LALQRNEAYIKSIQKVLTGELEYAKFNKDSILATANETQSPADLSTSEEELKLRKEVAEEEKKSQTNASKAKKK